jgi:hypothetical protein
MSAAVASQALPVVPEAEKQVPVSTPAPATLADALEEAQQRIVDLLTHPVLICSFVPLALTRRTGRLEHKIGAAQD